MRGNVTEINSLHMGDALTSNYKSREPSVHINHLAVCLQPVRPSAHLFDSYLSITYTLTSPDSFSHRNKDAVFIL